MYLLLNYYTLINVSCDAIYDSIHRDNDTLYTDFITLKLGVILLTIVIVFLLIIFLNTLHF